VSSEPRDRAAEVTVDLVVLNPASQPLNYAPPAELAGTLRNDQRGWVVTLRPAKPTAPLIIAAGQFANIPYVLKLPADLTGHIALEVSQVPSLQIAMDVVQGESRMDSLKQQEANAPPAMSGIERAFANRFGLQEPIYFLYGPEAPSVKFQFSFKYRLIGENGKFGDLIPPFRGLYFAYTQRSLWDTSADSSPFYDTSYMPELFFEWLAPQNGIAGGGFHWLGMQTGVGHESNGKDGVDSRSMNTAYLRAAMMFGVADGWRLLVVPRVFSYLDTGDENADIADYRGYGELQLAFGKNDSIQLGVSTRLGTSGKGSFQVDITQPVRVPVINLQTYLQLQYFDGYGESLRTYNQKSSIWRLGLAFAR
jgi:outer membrane phospholipase A